MGKIEIDGEEWGKLALENQRLRAQVTDLQRDMTNMLERYRLEKVGGILSGKAIESAVARGDIEINPYCPKHINPASIDLTLGRLVREYVLPAAPLKLTSGRVPDGHEGLTILDSKCELQTKLYDGDVFTLLPGRLYLMHTVEEVHTKHFVGCLDGKSSIGRLGVKVHETAGYIDPGFKGQPTLEVTVVHPVRLYAGMRIAQMRFHTIAGEKTSYQDTGNYVGDAALGPVASMAWKQFR